MNRFRNFIFALGVLGLVSLPQPVLACAACFGKNDSSMARGMNAGIFSLMAVIVTVLLGTAAVGIYFVKRASTLSQAAQK